MNHAVRVKTNRANPNGPIDVEIGDKTLIVGNNGSGKNAVLDALTFGAAGEMFDFAGRDSIRSISMLIQAAPDQAQTLYGEVTFADGRVSRHELNRTKRGASKGEATVAQKVAFPIQDVRKALTGTTNTARTWLLNNALSSVQLSDVLRMIPDDDIRSTFEAIADLTAPEGSDPEADVPGTINRVIEHASKQVRDANREIASVEAFLAEWGEVEDPTDAQIKRAEEDVELARGAWKKFSVIVQFRALAAARDAALERWQKALSKPADAPGPPPKDVDPLEHDAVPYIERALRKGHNNCPACGSEISATTTAAHFVRLREQRAAWQAWQEKTAAFDRIQREIEHAREAAQAAQRRLQAFAAEHSLDESVLNEQVDRPQEELEKAKDALAALKAKREAANRLRSIERTRSDARRKVRLMGPVVEEAKEVQGKLLKKAVARFTALVQSFLPESDVFRLVLDEDGKDVCKFGFVHTATDNLKIKLSGAEWVRLTVALAAAQVTNAESGVLHILVPEERAYDPKTLRAMMEALVSAPGQVILTHPSPPFRGRVAGWTIIDVDNLDDSQ